MEYRCSKAGQFEVALFVDIAYPSKINRTSVVLKQQKLCATYDKPVSTGSFYLEYQKNLVIIIICLDMFHNKNLRTSEKIDAKQQ